MAHNQHVMQGVILDIEDSIQQRYKRVFSHYKNSTKGTSDLNKPYVRNKFLKKINDQGQQPKAGLGFGLELPLDTLTYNQCMNSIHTSETESLFPKRANMQSHSSI